MKTKATKKPTKTSQQGIDQQGIDQQGIEIIASFSRMMRTYVHRYQNALLMMVVWIVVCYGLMVNPWLQVRMIVTPSVPYHLVVVYPNVMPHLGEYALIDYQGATIGSHHRGEMPHMKRLIAQGGHLITVRSTQEDPLYAQPQPADLIQINTRQGVWQGVAKTHGRDGTPLTAIKPQIIPVGWYFVANDHPDSFDSRYAAYGLVASSQILGKVVPLW
jgi:type IV secretory pathway protease TraF